MESAQPTGNPAEGRKIASSEMALSVVAEAVERLDYGAIQLTIHNGRVVQLEVTERQRFT